MACILHNNNEDLFKSMALQIEAEKKAKEHLELQLQKAKDKLNSVSKILTHKDHIINSLETDLEHLIDQLDKLQLMPKALTPKALTPKALISKTSLNSMCL